ncbi:hypothetical protein OROMI_016729 [Orobanche minor]
MSKYPEVPPDSGGKETGWIISWYTVPGSYRAPGDKKIDSHLKPYIINLDIKLEIPLLAIEKSPGHRLRDDTLYDDWPGWAEGPVPVIDDIMAYIASLPTDYSAYEEEPRESRQVYI